jgi:hypothetical protein
VIIAIILLSLLPPVIEFIQEHRRKRQLSSEA